MILTNLNGLPFDTNNAEEILNEPGTKAYLTLTETIGIYDDQIMGMYLQDIIVTPNLLREGLNRVLNKKG